MLEIIINGQSVDLSPDIQINLTIENPFVTEDRIPIPYSLSFDLPPTPKNLRLFKHPNRLATGFNVSDYDCTIRFQGLNISQGVLSVSKFDQQIQANFRGAEITDYIEKKLFENRFEKYTLGTMPEPSVDIDFDSGIGLAYKNLMQDAVDNNNGKFVLAPVRVTEESWTSWRRFDTVTGMPTPSAANMYINYFNARDKTWTFQQHNPYSSTTRTIHTTAYPFPYIHYLIDTIFGDSLDSNPFSTGELAKLVLLTFYHPAWKRNNGYFVFGPNYGLQNDYREFYTPLNKYEIYLDTRLPNLETKEFVRDLTTLFGFTLVPIKGKFHFKSNSDIIQAAVERNWTNKLTGRKSILKEPAKDLHYEYENDNNERVDPAGLKQMANYNQVYAYEPLPGREDEGQEDTLYIPATGEAFVKRATSDVNFTFEKKTSGFGSLAEGDNGFKLSSKLKPLELNISEYWTVTELPTGVEYPTFLHWVVPEFDGNREDRPEIGNIMFFHGLKSTFGATHEAPYLSPHQIDAFGNELGDLSLYWEGDRGLLNNFHMDLKSWVEKDKLKVSSAVQLQAIDFHQMDITDKIHLDGRDFFIEKILVTLRKDRIDPAIVDFIEA